MSIHLRLANDVLKPVEFIAGSVDEFMSNLNDAARLLQSGEEGGKDLHLYLCYAGSWWSLDANLPAYCYWKVESGRSTSEDVSAFVARPLSRPVWLYEAAVQMSRLLRAAEGHTPVVSKKGADA